MYTYNATLLDVTDGDTIKVRIDMGFRVSCEQSIRINMVDTPEMFSGSIEERAEGRKAKAYLQQLLADNPLTLVTWKDARQSFNRWCADVFINYGTPTEKDIAKTMVQAGFEKQETYTGHAARYFSANRRGADLANAGVEE